MTAFTKGPWEIDNDYRPGMSWNRHIVSAENPDVRICFLTHSNGKNPDQDAANARLIAAAPELCDAVESVLNYAVMDDFLDGKSHENLVFGIRKSDLLKLRSALAKAKGPT
jgi:hypothetical protein